MHEQEVDLTKCPKFPNRLVVGGENRRWLQKYINDEEIDQFFFYDPVMDRHVFLHNEDEPTWFYSARSVKDVPEKAMQRGITPCLLMGRWKETKTLVIVEDIVSAIKVSRYYGALPLFGSHLTANMVDKIAKSKQIDRVVVWLDDDKIMRSRVYSRKLTMVLPTISVWTELDPKDYSDEEIVEEIENALEMMNESENPRVSS